MQFETRFASFYPIGGCLIIIFSISFANSQPKGLEKESGSAERCKLSWAWVLECVLSPQRSGMVSREVCCHSRVPGPQPWATLCLLLALPTLALQWIPKKSQLPTQEIEKMHRCRRSVDYFLIDRSIGHGRYRRSIRIHLLGNTVDIDGR